MKWAAEIRLKILIDTLHHQGGHKIQSLALEDQELVESSYPTSKPILCYSMSDLSLLHRIKVENIAEASTPKVQSKYIFKTF